MEFHLPHFGHQNKEPINTLPPLESDQLSGAATIKGAEQVGLETPAVEQANSMPEANGSTPDAVESAPATPTVESASPEAEAPVAEAAPRDPADADHQIPAQV